MNWLLTYIVCSFQVLQALTTQKCSARLSLERFEVLGDAFLKYIVGRHSFLSYATLDEGKLTELRSSIVKNLNLYELAIKNNLQVKYPPSPSVSHPFSCFFENKINFVFPWFSL